MAEVSKDPTDVEKVKQYKEVQKLQQSVAEGLEKIGRVIVGIEEKFKESKTAHITVKKHTMPNVYINVNGAEFLIRQEGKGGKFIRFGMNF